MSTEVTSSAPGSGAMKTQPVSLSSASVTELLSSLAMKLTELEKLGLLSATGKSLLLLCPQMTPTQSMPGVVEKKEGSGMSTYHPVYGPQELQQASQQQWQDCSMTFTSPGLKRPRDTSVALAHMDFRNGASRITYCHERHDHSLFKCIAPPDYDWSVTGGH